MHYAARVVEGISELSEGFLLGERYRLARRLEVFSVGADRVAGVRYEYWLALDEATGDEVWIQFAAAAGVYAEGAALAGAVAGLRRINHPAVPAVFAFGEYEFEQAGALRTVGYCAVPAVAGETLAAALVRETVDRAEVLVALGQVAEVLELLGEFELVHGHLSAHSVLLTATAEARYEVVLADLPASLALETTVESDLTAAADVYALAWLTVLALVGPRVLEAEFGAGFAATLEQELPAAQVIEQRRAWAAENLEVLGVSAALVEVLLPALGEASSRPRVTRLAAAIRAAWVEIQQQAAAVEVVEAVELAEAAEVAVLTESVEAAAVVAVVGSGHSVESGQAIETVQATETVDTVAARKTGAARKTAARKPATKKKTAEAAGVIGAAAVVGLAAESASAAAGTAVAEVSGTDTGSAAVTVGVAGGGAAGSGAGTASGAAAAGGVTALVGETAAAQQVLSGQESAGAVTEVIPIVGGGRRGRGSSGGSAGGSAASASGGSAATVAGAVGLGGSGSAGSTAGSGAEHARRPRRGLYAGVGVGVLVAVALIVALSQGSNAKTNAASTVSTASAGSASAGSAVAGGAVASPSAVASSAGGAGSPAAAAAVSPSPAASQAVSTAALESVTFPATLETYPANAGEAVQEIQQAVTKAQSELSPTEQGKLNQIISTLNKEIEANQSLSTGTAQLWALVHSGELPSSFSNYLEQLASYLSASAGS